LSQFWADLIELFEERNGDRFWKDNAKQTLQVPSRAVFVA